MTEPKAIPFSRFGGLRLDQAIDEVGPENAIYLRDVDWDGTTGKIRPRDGFQKLKTAEASGYYEGLFPHSSARLLVTKRVNAESLKLVAVDSGCVEKAEIALRKNEARPCFARFGTSTASYTYMRTDTPEQKVVRFDGTTFTEPTATLNKNPDGSGGTAGKAMPKAALMIAWPAGDNRFVVANTGAAGGPGGAASSNSHVWFSDPGDAESWHTDFATQAGEANYVPLSPGDGEEITALAVWEGALFVFKETKFFRFFGVSEDGEGRPEFDFTEVALGESTRVKLPKSALSSGKAQVESSDQLAIAAPGGVYFCASDGIYATTGGAPGKVSLALRPLEEMSHLEGPMSDLLEDIIEICRWPATGITSLGQRILVRRPGFIFELDLPTGEWLCQKVFSKSMAVWNGLESQSGSLRPRLLITQTKFIGFSAPLAKDELSKRSPEWQSGFYDLGAQDEKTLEGGKVWGRGKVTVAGYRDFEATADFEDELDLGEGAIEQGRAYSTQTATLFSHRLRLEPGSSVQRVVRYLRETELAGGWGSP